MSYKFVIIEWQFIISNQNKAWKTDLNLLYLIKKWLNVNRFFFCRTRFFAWLCMCVSHESQGDVHSGKKLHNIIVERLLSSATEVVDWYQYTMMSMSPWSSRKLNIEYQALWKVSLNFPLILCLFHIFFVEEHHTTKTRANIKYRLHYKGKRKVG